MSISSNQIHYIIFDGHFLQRLYRITFLAFTSNIRIGGHTPCRMVKIIEVRRHGNEVGLNLDLHLPTLIGREKDKIAEILHSIHYASEQFEGRHVNTHLKHRYYTQ